MARSIALAPSIPLSPQRQTSHTLQLINPALLTPSELSLAIYGDPTVGIEDLQASIQENGILVPLVVIPQEEQGRWTILSGSRRWRCALSTGLAEVPCEVHNTYSSAAQRRIILEYNRQRRKSFSQLMREADVLEELLKGNARQRQLVNLHQFSPGRATSIKNIYGPDRRNSDTVSGVHTGAFGAIPEAQLTGRTDTLIAAQLGLGGKDLYRQARAIWKKACQNDVRAQASVALLDSGMKTIYAAYKDLRRRDQFTSNFKPTPYDVWAFHHDRAFGVPHPGSTPPSIVAHALYYFSPPGGLIIDPMAGGGTVLDVCASMGRRCLAYDLAPVRPDIQQHDICQGFPVEAQGCDLIFCDPPYHTMLSASYTAESISSAPLQQWNAFLDTLAHAAFQSLRPGGYLALLLAPQTEKDLPSGYGYLDHTVLGYLAATRAGFLPERRISCPMNSAYVPQQVRQARAEGRLLGQVRDLLVLRKPMAELL